MPSRIDPEDFKKRRKLASYAVQESIGRIIFQESDGYRTEFHRDRDRIIHSKPFRRLLGKTQVFLAVEADHYRTRLTHTLEVHQLATSIARYLGLNEDLTGVISLAHDLGHTPFGHAVESLMNELMVSEGGFDHHLQSVRVVSLLEERAGSEGAGLNLTLETLEGILKHSRDRLGKLELMWLNNTEYPGFDLSHPGSLEAQVVAICDDIAHAVHDFDDSIRAGLVKKAIEEGIESPEYENKIWDLFHLTKKSEKHTRLILDKLVRDVTETTLDNLNKAGIENYDDVRMNRNRLVELGKYESAFKYLNAFKSTVLIESPMVSVLNKKARKFIDDLWHCFTSEDGIRCLPWKEQRRIEQNNEVQQQRYKDYGWYISTDKRIITDYIAGMTDSYALGTYGYLFEHPSSFRY